VIDDVLLTIAQEGAYEAPPHGRSFALYSKMQVWILSEQDDRGPTEARWPEL
jgi:hypothetical protein